MANPTNGSSATSRKPSRTNTASACRRTPYRITENWFHHSLLLDFTNPQAVKWWFDKRKYLLDMGVEGFKTDGGEFLFDYDAKLHNGKAAWKRTTSTPGSISAPIMHSWPRTAWTDLPSAAPTMRGCKRVPCTGRGTS